MVAGVGRRVSGKQKERRKGEGGVRNVMQTPGLRETKGTGRLADGLRGRDAHSPRGAGAGRPRPAPPPPARGQPRSSPRKYRGGGGGGLRSAPLCCDREGRLVLTARGDWQASEPLRSLVSRSGVGPTNPHSGGVCPNVKNGMCAVPASRPRRARVLEGPYERARECAPAGAPCIF